MSTDNSSNNEETSFWKKALSTIVEFEDDKNKNQQNPASNATVNKVQETTYATPAPSTGTVEQKFVDEINNRLSAAKIAKPNYLDFVQALNNMNNIPGLTEEQKVMAAWSTFKAFSGISPLELKNSAIAYLTVLEDERKAFKALIAQKTDEKVGSILKKISAIDENNKKATEQILALQKTIDENSIEASKLRSEADEQTIKITASEKNYDASWSMIFTQINENIRRIESNVK